jgi:hypothetical protein
VRRLPAGRPFDCLALERLVPCPDGSAVLPRRAALPPAAEPAPCPDAPVQPLAGRRAPVQQMVQADAPESRRERALRQGVRLAAHSVVHGAADQALAAHFADARLVAVPKVPLPVVPLPVVAVRAAAVTVRRLAAQAAWGRRVVEQEAAQGAPQVAVEQVAAQDARRAAVLQEVAQDGQQAVSAAERPDVAVAERLEVRVAPADAVRLLEAASELPWA